MREADSAPTILLVEDDRLLLRMLASALDEEGLAPATADRAEKGLAALETLSDITLIITDINMPGMNGVELLRRVRARHPHVRQMVISGRPDLCENLLPADIDFLAKPFTARQFVERVRSALAPSGI